MTSVKLAEECTYAVLAFSFTTDMWSSRVLDSYFSFTNCYTHETDFKLQSIALENTTIVGSKTADIICDAFNKSLDDWNLPKKVPIFCERHNGTNLQAVVQNYFDWYEVSYFAIHSNSLFMMLLINQME